MIIYRLISDTCAMSYFTNRATAIREVQIHALLSDTFNKFSLLPGTDCDVMICEDIYGSSIEVTPTKVIDHRFLLTHITIEEYEPSTMYKELEDIL
jgi:hypothetical protein